MVSRGYAQVKRYERSLEGYPVRLIAILRKVVRPVLALGAAPINSSRDGQAAENAGERGAQKDTSKTFQEVINRIVENLSEVE